MSSSCVALMNLPPVLRLNPHKSRDVGKLVYAKQVVNRWSTDFFAGKSPWIKQQNPDYIFVVIIDGAWLCRVLCSSAIGGRKEERRVQRESIPLPRCVFFIVR